ncbi:MAG: SEC-C domain-containing protein [Lachnospiraceae bacterium]|nr:SEC-C domain-containing protein [Lachnospiraceae bacterium]
MALLDEWRDRAYGQGTDAGTQKKLWEEYFAKEKAVYEQLLEHPDEVVTGTVKELAERFHMTVSLMTGFLDGINDSLKEPNPIEDMTEDTEVRLAFDTELLYKNMVAAKADWLYRLPQWDAIFDREKQDALHHEQINSGTFRREGVKIMPNDPCPCGSGKKYKKCHGRGK